MSNEAKCPFVGGARTHAGAGAPSNANWWPHQLNLKILHQHSALSGLDPVIQYRRYIQVTDCFSLNTVGGKYPNALCG
ncbi:hypothetical protein B9Z41_05135 [Limnohabitans sp. JirII-31]|nr:hypothetical protein B9Z41_05135 [Limnohabitans sp. JirII-31]